MIAAIILAGSLMPRGSVGDPGSADKSMHLVAFAVLAFPVALSRPRWFAAILLGLMCFGAMIELFQPLFGRSGSIDDLAANGGGVVLGILAGAVFRPVASALRPEAD